MASSHWDEQLAARYRAFRYDFADRTLAGRLIVVAGGTGGLGAATVALLAREGAKLIVGYRANRERAESLRGVILKEFGQNLTLIEGDVYRAEVRRAYGEAIAAAGTPLSGAAIFPGEAARVPWEQLDGAALEASLRSNYVAPILLAKDLGENMQNTDAGGNLVLLATMQAVSAFPGSLNYAAPKAALVHAARILAKQWRRVRVNVVAPGATVGGMAEASVSAGKYDAYLTNGTIPRFGRPEDIARAIRFFLEPDGYSTGQVLVVDGGLTL
jgi:NAD(P)-dependent dehydrogenase (short-subunit alcohol dehydrogenase family)